MGLTTATYAVGKQIQMSFFNPVFHLALECNGQKKPDALYSLLIKIQIELQWILAV
jgi:hypothetical protein